MNLPYTRRDDQDLNEYCVRLFEAFLMKNGTKSDLTPKYLVLGVEEQTEIFESREADRRFPPFTYETRLYPMRLIVGPLDIPIICVDAPSLFLVGYDNPLKLQMVLEHDRLAQGRPK